MFKVLFFSGVLWVKFVVKMKENNEKCRNEGCTFFLFRVAYVCTGGKTKGGLGCVPTYCTTRTDLLPCAYRPIALHVSTYTPVRTCARASTLARTYATLERKILKSFSVEFHRN